MATENDTWDIYKDKRGEHRWRRRAENGSVLGSACEGYTQKTDCIKNAQRHGMDGNPDGLGLTDRWEVYKDKRNHFRWRRYATNRAITGASSGAFKLKKNAEANARCNGMP